ncbi:MAG: cytochrome c, partial [Phycisphaerae bacterium]|nr:cytochrome c [Phycisphaerae bacterium]
VATLLQLFAGPIVWVTLPQQGISASLLIVIGIGATLGTTAIALMGFEIISSAEKIGRQFVPIATLLILTGSCMAFGRHLYREKAIFEHRMLMAQHTADLHYEARAAAWRAEHGIVIEDLPLGARVFRDACSNCHAVDHVLVGPSIREIAQLYKGNPAGIVTWAKSPGKKRTGFPQMPTMFLPNAQLKAAAEHMLELGSTRPANTIIAVAKSFPTYSREMFGCLWGRSPPG